MAASQHIASTKIDDAYDALHAKHKELIEGLLEIKPENTNLGMYNYIQKLCEKASDE